MTLRHYRRSLSTSFVLLLQLSLLAPLVQSIGNAESPEYTMIELQNGTILIFEPGANISESLSPPPLEEDNNTQPAFVYHDLQLGLPSDPNVTAAEMDFDFVGEDWGDENSLQWEDYQQATVQNWNNENSDNNDWKNGDNKSSGNGNNKEWGMNNNKNNQNTQNEYGYGQQGFLVKEEETMDADTEIWDHTRDGYPLMEEMPDDGMNAASIPGAGTGQEGESDFGYEQAGYLEMEDPTIDSEPGNERGDREKEEPAVASAEASDCGRRFLRGA